MLETLKPSARFVMNGAEGFSFPYTTKKSNQVKVFCYDRLVYRNFCLSLSQDFLSNLKTEYNDYYDNTDRRRTDNP